MKRRNFIRNLGIALGGLGAAGLGYRLTRTPSGDYTPYFRALNQTLKGYKRALPLLLIDLDLLDYNLAVLSKSITPQKHFRVVVKSLPAPALVRYVQTRTHTTRLMCFHQPFLSQISSTASDTTDILLGKPMPVRTVAYYYDTLKVQSGFDPLRQVQWLVDTPLRVQEYITLAKAKNLCLRLNLEIDVGLHRGGFDRLDTLAEALGLIAQHPTHVQLAGLMGYDPHLAKIPSVLRSREQGFVMMRDFYEACKHLIRTRFPTLWHTGLTFNGAGSPTLMLHNRADSPLNELSAGSFAVKPTDFDLDTLNAFKPAAFIAAPILKKAEGLCLPALEGVSRFFKYLDPNTAQSYFIYGGAWMAEPHSPAGLQPNGLFGKSTNQMMFNASINTPLGVDDFVFFRPHQSEAVFLQFGDILGIRSGKVVEEWAVFGGGA